MADYDITISDNIAASIAKKLTDIGNAAIKTDGAVARLKATLAGFSSASSVFNSTASSATKLATAVNTTASGVNKLNAANRAATSSTTQLAQASQRATSTLTQQNNALQRNARSAGTYSNAGRQLLTGLLALASVHTFIDLANDADQLNNKLLNVSTSSEDFTRLQKAMFDQANATRTAVQSYTDAFVRYDKVLVPLGVSQEKIIQFTSTLTKAFIAAGKTTEEASAGVIQLGQALQSGRLQGDEFRSVMENMPVEVLQALAAQLGTSVTNLKKLSTQGKITTDVMLKAILSLTDTIDQKFNRSIVTVGQAFTILQNKAVEFFTSNTGPARIFANVILTIADHLDYVIPAIAGFAAAWALVQFASLISDLGLLVLAFTPLTVQVGLFTAAFVGAVGLLVLFARTIALVTGQTAAFDAYLNSVGASIGDMIGNMLVAARAGLGFDSATAAIKSLDTQAKSAAQSTGVLAGNFQSMGQNAPGIQSVNTAMAGLSTSTSAAANASKSLATNSKDAVTALGPGVRGAYGNIIDVSKALGTADQSAKTLALDGKTVVEQLKSVGGQATGIYRLTPAFQSATAAANATATAAQRAANAIRAAASAAGGATAIAQYNDLLSKGGSSGSFQAIKPPSSTISSPSFQTLGPTGASSIINIGQPTSLGAFADGGSIMVKGKAGIDKNRVSMDVSRGERIDILTPQQQREAKQQPTQIDSRRYVSVNIQTPNADSFRRSRKQIGADLTAIAG